MALKCHVHKKSWLGWMSQEGNLEDYCDLLSILCIFDIPVFSLILTSRWDKDFSNEMEFQTKHTEKHVCRAGSKTLTKITSEQE